MASPFEIRVLGDLAVVRGGRLLALPPRRRLARSWATLVVCAQPQPRQRLCELLERPDDPRAALRWSLSKLRPVVDDDDHVRIVADRDHIAFQARGAAIDLAFVVETARDAGNASLEALKVAAELPTGELLEGLDLPECYRYHEWCVAERETARRARITVLGTLVDRFADRSGGRARIRPRPRRRRPTGGGRAHRGHAAARKAWALPRRAQAVRFLSWNRRGPARTRSLSRARGCANGARARDGRRSARAERPHRPRRFRPQTSGRPKRREHGDCDSAAGRRGRPGPRGAALLR